MGLVSEDHVVPLPIPGLSDAHLKIEGLNPAGSIKIKPAFALLADAERLMDLRDRPLVESTSGSMGIALASLCAARGYDLTCVVDPNTNPTNIAIMEAFGAGVVRVSKRDENGGYLGTRLDWIRQQLEVEPRTVWLDQYRNIANARAHEEMTARGVLAAFSRVDHLVIGVGTGGTLMGCIKAFRTHSPHTRITAVDIEGSVSFGGPAGPRHLPGLGASVAPPLVDREAPDRLVTVAESEAVRECRWMAKRTGVLLGASSGAVLSAIRGVAPSLASDSTVVGIAPDLGERYMGTVYDDGWVRSRGWSDALENPIPVTR